MNIDIFSDVICPWCFLGKRRLEQALDELGWRDEVTVRWRAFQLDPRATAEPRDLRAAIERKYGPGSFDAMTRRLAALGEPVGITYRFDLAQRVSTVDAHRLLAWALDVGGTSAQGALCDRLMRGYFEQGANVADRATLTDLAGDAGLDPTKARRMLDDGGYGDAVVADLREAAERDIFGVPAFVVDGSFTIPGAQEVSTFRSLLERCHP